MKLPNLPIGKSESPQDYYLALTLRFGKVTASILEVSERRARVVGFGEESFKDGVENADFNEFLNVLDRAISTAEQDLPESVETQKTIFAVKESWVEGGKIKPEYLEKLKKASSELDLKPVGFLVTTEALLHLLQKEEGAPVSGIVVEASPQSVIVSLVRAGRVVETKSSEIHESAAFTANALLKHLTTPEVIPSKIIVYDADEKMEQEFIGFSWSKSLPFLHPPQIKALPKNYDSRAVVSAAAAQLNFSLSEESLKNIEGAESLAPPSDLSFGQFPEGKEAIEGQSEQSFTSDNLSSDFGFSEEDIAKPKADKIPEREDLEKVSEIPLEMTAQESKREMPQKAMEVAEGGKRLVGSFLKNLKPQVLRLFSQGSTRRRFLVPAVLAFFVFAFLFFYLFGTKAQILLSVEKKTVSQNENITFTAEGATDASQNIIKGNFVSREEEGKLSIDSTGKKQTGDKAKGTVTIFNNSSSSRTLSEGTVITAEKDSLKFTLDKSVTVASASGDVFLGTPPGKADVGVTAEKFGTNYNLPSNSKFSVADNSSIAAKNDNAFSGGTTKEITVVSQKDIDKLLKELPADLEKKARGALLGEMAENEKLLPVFIGQEFIRREFSRKVDDEATAVALTAVIEFQGISYKESDLIEFAKANLEEDIDENLTINEGDVELDVKDIEKEGDEVSASLVVSANLIPKVSEDDLIKTLQGKSFNDAQRILSDLPNVKSVSIKQSPPIPLLPKFLPRSGKNIKLEISAQ
ncbi:MAG: baseplate J/gp47 family protein [Patescibacteria group bacterium]